MLFPPDRCIDPPRHVRKPSDGDETRRERINRLSDMQVSLISRSQTVSSGVQTEVTHHAQQCSWTRDNDVKDLTAWHRVYVPSYDGIGHLK